MEKQHNRGQDGAGLATLKLDMPAGAPYIARERVVEPAPPWQTLFKRIGDQLATLEESNPGLMDDPDRLKTLFPFAGELMMGHLRYATHGANSERECHPVIRANNWQSRTLLVAGNFNLTNNDELFAKLVELGQHPDNQSDTVTVLERLGHFLDTAVQGLFDAAKRKGIDDNRAISDKIARELNLLDLLCETAEAWDGGFAIGGMIGHGDFFVMRDPNGIRPAYYFYNEEIAVVASERQAIATTFGIDYSQIFELPRAHAFLCKKDGRISIAQYAGQQARTSCSFERIYFSRGSDAQIYEERKRLGNVIVPQILDAIDHDLENTVFSYIPNTAKVAFWGMLKGLEDHLNEEKVATLMEWFGDGDLARTKAYEPMAKKLLSRRVRVENVILKDTKMRTFITNDNARDHMAAHVYDITYGSVRPGLDQLVCIDDSIVRGTTLKQSILRILKRLQPKKIVIASSAPQIRYPDCYGIDMSQIERFIAFQAAVSLLRKRGQESVLQDIYHRCIQAKNEGQLHSQNFVQALYAPFSDKEISAEIAELLGKDLGCELVMVFQTVENLHRAIPDHLGDWYFTGNFPTPGGTRVVNQAFINYYEGRNQRAY
jgi:amidophosphoribosyltransferase